MHKKSMASTRSASLIFIAHKLLALSAIWSSANIIPVTALFSLLTLPPNNSHLTKHGKILQSRAILLYNIHTTQLIIML